MNAPWRDAAQPWLDDFARLAPGLPGQRHGWLRQAREEAMRRFAAIGLPTRRDEEWKYTDVAAIGRRRFAPAGAGAQAASGIETCFLPGAHRLVFVNGYLVPGLCRLGRLPGGVTLCGLGELLAGDPAGLEALLGADRQGPAFAALNLAFAADGAYLRLAPGCVLEVPIQLLYVATGDDLAIQPRNLILAAAGSSARVVEQHVAVGAARYLTNAVTDLVLGADAELEHHKLQEEGDAAFHIAAVRARQAAGSRLVSSSFAFGASLARVGIDIDLAGEGAACRLDGLYLAGGRQHIDHHTRVDHRQPGGSSRQLYKGIADGAGRAVFNGRVVVRPQAQRSDALQSNRNLLLSAQAEIDTKPELEIWADDVKCGHGATVGQLDEDQVFYLRSRGLDEPAARAILIQAFAREVVDRVPLPALQDRLDGLLHLRL